MRRVRRVVAPHRFAVMLAVVMFAVAASATSDTKHSVGSGSGSGSLSGSGSDLRTASWGLSCPAACTCHAGPFLEVPLRRALASYQQYLTQDDPELNETLSVRQAACVVLSDSYEDLLAGLPADTQALTLLQGADDDPVVLIPEHLSRFPGLLALEVTAFREAGVHLRSDALRALLGLRLLGLSGVQLKGTLMEDTDDFLVTTAAPAHPRRRLPPWMYFTDQNSEETPQLVFLKPAEVVPFSRFSEIRRLSAMKTFSGLEHLVMLRLHGADMVDVTWEMFDGLEKLQVLSLEGNGMAYLPDWSLYGAPRLRHLSLANNELLEVSSTALVGLLELQSLDLSHNNLSHLSELSLPPFPRLVRADFRGNPIEEIFTSTFQVMNATETLLLGGSGTALQLRADMFQGLRALRTLGATDVSLQALDREVLRGMPRLKELTLRGSIPILPYDSFIEVPKLERLVLRQCGLRSVSMDAFYGLLGLLELDLSHNQLRYLPPNLFDQQTSLRELRLDGNQLTELPSTLLTPLPAKMIRLDNNPWDCSCDMSSWNPAATNKDKRDGRYVYDKRASPVCSTPERYQGWSVFDAMRRGFRCNKNPSTRIYSRPNAVPVASNDTPNVILGAISNVTPNATYRAVASNETNEMPNATRNGTSNAVSEMVDTTPSNINSPEALASSSILVETTTSPNRPTVTSNQATGSSTAASWSQSTDVTASSASPLDAFTKTHGHKALRPHKRHRLRKHRQHQVSEESVAGDGPHGSHAHYQLSDGKGGFITVSKKAYKLAMEQRRKLQTSPPPAPAPAA